MEQFIIIVWIKKTQNLLKEAENVDNYKIRNFVTKYFVNDKLIGFVPNIEKDKKFKELGYSITIW